MSSYDMTALQAELIRDENERLKPYIDSVGKTSIGIGRNLDDVGISHDESLYLFANDVVRAEGWLDRNTSWWRELDPVRQRVLVNMAFNLGGRLAGFRLFLVAVQAHQWQRAHDEMLDSKWTGQVGTRSIRLAKMMLTGESA